MEAIAEPSTHARKPFFNAENAKRWSAVGNETKRALAEARKLAKEAPQGSVAPALGIPEDVYRIATLRRVRKQLDGLFRTMEALLAAEEIDAQKIDRVASAIARLSELERNLAGRASPGSLRPSAKGSKPQVHAIPEPIRKPESM